MTIAEQLVRNAQKQVSDSVNRGRRNEMLKRIDYYYDGQFDYLDGILRKRFAEPSRLKLQKASRNIVKRIIDKISLLYKTEPSRTLVDEKGEPIKNSIQQRVQNEIWNPAKINNVCSTAEKMMNLCRTVGIKVSYRNRLQYDIKTPAELDVVQNEENVMKANAVIYRRELRTDTPGVPKKFEYIVWTDNEHFKINADEYGEQKGERPVILRDKQPIGNNIKMVNPYGVIPFAWYRYDYNWRTFFNEGGQDLIHAQENINVKLTDLNQLIKMQSWSVPVLIGYDTQTGDPIVIDPTIPLVIPFGREGADFKFVSPNAKIAEVWKCIVEGINGIATDYDIAPGSFQLTGSVRSGLELKLENVGLYDRAWGKRTYALDFEEQLWHLTKIIGRMKGLEWIPENAKLIVKYDDIQIPEDPVKEQLIWTWKFQFGVATPVDYLIFKNPNMSRTEAEKVLQMNLKFNKQLKEQFPSLKGLFEKQAKEGAA